MKLNFVILIITKIINSVRAIFDKCFFKYLKLWERSGVVLNHSNKRFIGRADVL